MKASQARTLSKKNAKLPKDVLNWIKQAANDGLTSINFMGFVRELTSHERHALELNGYDVSTNSIKDVRRYYISWN